MLNCPGCGANIVPVVGSSSSVHVSAVSRRGAGPCTAGAPSVVPCDGQRLSHHRRLRRRREPEACRVGAARAAPREAGHQLVAERRVRLALAAQAGAVELDRPDRRNGAGVEVPAVRREEPRPADDVAGFDGLDRERSPAGHVELERDPPSAQDVEDVRRLSFAEQGLAGVEADRFRRSRRAARGRPRRARRTGVLEDDLIKSFCITGSLLAADGGRLPR